VVDATDPVLRGGVLQAALLGAGGSYFINSTVGTYSTDGEWNDVLMQVYDGVFYTFINGYLTYAAPVLDGVVNYVPGGKVIIGGNNPGSTSRSANIGLDEFRFVKGLAVLVPNPFFLVRDSSFPEIDG
jgi:hypothetical protein